MRKIESFLSVADEGDVGPLVEHVTEGVADRVVLVMQRERRRRRVAARVDAKRRARLVERVLAPRRSSQDA